MDKKSITSDKVAELVELYELFKEWDFTQEEAGYLAIKLVYPMAQVDHTLDWIDRRKVGRIG